LNAPVFLFLFSPEFSRGIKGFFKFLLNNELAAFTSGGNFST